MDNPELYMQMQRLKFTAMSDFKKITKDSDRVKFCLKNLLSTTIAQQSNRVKLGKCEMKAAIARKKGNDHFKLMGYAEALMCYNESLCFAPIGSQSIGIAYANRSQIYLKSGHYSFCLENIDLALENGYPDDLRPKLLVRKETCLRRLKDRPDTADVSNGRPPMKLSHPANTKIAYVIDALKVEKNQKYGRCVMTTTKLQPGDVVLIEKPFTLCSTSTYSHCFNCLSSAYYNLQPCPRSTKVMFCSKKCSEQAWKRFYMYIHSCIDELLDNSNAIFALSTTLKAFTMFEDSKNLTNFVESINVEQETGFNLNSKKYVEADKFKAFYSLALNETKLDPDVLYEITNSCANAWKLMMDVPEIKALLDDDTDFFLELLMRFAIIIETNSHAILNPEQSEIGKGVSLIYSLLNHSCSPNVVRVHYQEDKFGLVVIRPIKAGQQLFVSYGPLYSEHNRLERRKELQLRYNFYCECEACEMGYELRCNLQQKNSISARTIGEIKRAHETGCYNDEVMKTICERSASSDHLHPCWDTHFLHESLVNAMYAKFSHVPMKSNQKLAKPKK